MATIELTKENFRSVVERGGILLIDWWAPWCGPCRAFAPVFEAASTRHEDAVFAKINTDDQPELAAVFDITAIPTLMVFRDGILVFVQPGVLPESALDQVVTEVRKLDMDEVRREIERAENESRPQQIYSAEPQPDLSKN